MWEGWGWGGGGGAYPQNLEKEKQTKIFTTIFNVVPKM